MMITDFDVEIDPEDMLTPRGLSKHMCPRGGWMTCHSNNDVWCNYMDKQMKDGLVVEVFGENELRKFEWTEKGEMICKMYAL